jgi:hypothetical protein
MKRNAGEASSPAALGKRGDLCNDRYTNGGTGSRARQTLQHCPEEIGPIQAEGVNTIRIASTEHRDFGGQGLVRVRHTYIY